MANRIIAGRYELLKPVGRGGMSIVYLAADLTLKKNWAVKEVRKHAYIGGMAVQNTLLAEAQMMKNLDHPSLPKIIDIIEERDFYYIVMDYIEGETLREIIDRYGPQEQNQVISWAKELTLVLGYLHAQDPPIIYRDLKPGNIILQPNGSLKIIDFGTAREYKQGQARDTAPLGTKGYAAPEQYDTGDGQSAQTDERTDIYTLGMTMYELLTCKLPDKAPYKLVPVRQIRPELSVGIEKIIEKCTQSDPDDRFNDTEEVMTALLNYQKLDAGYIREQKRKLFKALIPCVAGLLLILGGFGCLTASHHITENNYEHLIAETADRDSHIENLKKAIELKPEEPEAYRLLIQEYAKEEGGLTESNAQEVLGICSEGLRSVNPKSQAYLDINYMIGEANLVYYTGETDRSLRTKIMAAQPYFSAVVNSEKENYENYDLCRVYVDLADFYEEFLLDSDDSFVFDAKKEDYEKVMKDFNQVIGILKKNGRGNNVQLQIATYNMILNILDSEKNNFVVNVSINKINKVLSAIKRESAQIETANETLRLQKEQLVEYVASVEENIAKAYKESRKEG